MLNINFFILVLTLSACSSMPQKLTDRSERQEMGFSFKPPQKGQWMELPRKFDNYGIELKSRNYAFIKELEQGSDYYVSFIVDVGLNFFASKKNKTENLKSWPEFYTNREFKNSRFKIRKNTSTPIKIKGVSCVKINSLVDDLHAAGGPKILETHSVFCLHPREEYNYIHLIYSQRYPPNKAKLNIAAEGEAFLQSIKF